MRSWSKRSKDALVGVSPLIISVLDEALQTSPVDFMVIEGVRTEARQRQLYNQGRITLGDIVTWTLNSAHFVNKKTGYGHAVDLLPEPYDWKDKSQFKKMAEAVIAAAKRQGVNIRWGGDWDSDGIIWEKGESDSPHFELKE